MTPAQYQTVTGRAQTMDASRAARAAIARLLGGLRWQTTTGRTSQFQKVYMEWPTSNDRFASPSACVLEASPLSIPDVPLTPSILEETWAPRGGPGLALYRTADGEQTFSVVLRASSKPERSDASRAVSDLFQGVPDNPRRARSGFELALPDYWNLTAGALMASVTTSDDAESAMRNRWEAAYALQVSLTIVTLRRAVPMMIKVVSRTDGEPG